MKDKSEQTALIYVVKEGCAEIADFLVEYGVDTKQQSAAVHDANVSNVVQDGQLTEVPVSTLDETTSKPECVDKQQIVACIRK